MSKIFKYAFFTSMGACLFIAVTYLIILTFLESGGDLMISSFLRLSLLSAILMFLVPWLCSTLFLVLALQIFGRGGGAKRRWLLGGLSVGVVHLAFYLWGNVSPFAAIWALGGFGAGYLAAFIVDRIMEPEFDD